MPDQGALATYTYGYTIYKEIIKINLKLPWLPRQLRLQPQPHP